MGKLIDINALSEFKLKLLDLVGANNGIAGLDSNGKIPSSQLPSYVDDVLEYATHSNFPLTGETGKIYVALDTGKIYRWSGSEYVEISNPDIMSGATASSSGTAGLVPAPASGDQGKFLRGDGTWQTALTTHQDISGKKNVQTAVSDPTASGNALSFIDAISQDTQGVITASKKNVSVDSAPTQNSTNPITSGAAYDSFVATQSGIAIIATGNTHGSITSGQFVFVRNHGTLAEGLYQASANIAQNAALSTSNLTSVPGGGLNALNSKIQTVHTVTMPMEYFDVTEGTIGTRAGQEIYTNELLGKTIIGTWINYISDSTKVIPFAFKSDNNLYLNIYRATSSAASSIAVQLGYAYI